ncbi:unnamed protein product [Acanthoscelides obtectus]|uniref:Tc1-like transposase DDE domain-containing protein n=1 Tax=Acanthoscelides obtectus TaxID=200917 RepID=A0A9P0LTV4_ACAOB|nr:unnamed protein product [Acanthoscelides obtectus]CAK1620783.1 hypothetical protein AOBTE_LOCUS568 [Acanthoscelides obtectus]
MEEWNKPWENAPSQEEMVDEPVQAEFFHKDLEEQTQRVILNMYDCLKNENPDFSQNQILNRICIRTKISRYTIYRVIKRGDVVNHSFHRKRIGQKLNRIDVGFQEDIRLGNDKLKDYPEDFYNYKCLDSLHCIVKLCGFQYKKLDKRMVIMESSRIVELRQEFLHKVKIYREQKRNLIYLDETWYDTLDVVQYGWDMTSDLFEKWTDQQLIANISPNSVIIMDNAQYHSRQKNKIPNTGTKKQDIIDFQNGHEVLHLPPYYCIFNPIELVWAALKKNESLLATIRDAVSHIAATDLWKPCSRHIIEKENEYCVLPPLNPVVIPLQDDSSDSSECEDDI